jgi:TRAP-type C4-dicarboxylate transport system substrate-binding protein
VHLLISERAFQSLSPEHRAVVLQAAREAAAYGRAKVRELDKKLVAELETKGGVKISPLKPGEREKFIEVMRSTVWAEYGDPVGKERIQKIVETR